jgi:hypothetical protein
MSQVVWICLIEAAAKCPWTAYQCAQQLCTKTLYISKMDAGSSLRGLSASTMTLCHHFDSMGDPVPVPQNMTQVLVWGYICVRMTLCHHFDSTSDSVPQHLTQEVWV